MISGRLLCYLGLCFWVFKGLGDLGEGKGSLWKQVFLFIQVVIFKVSVFFGVDLWVSVEVVYILDVYYNQLMVRTFKREVVEGLWGQKEKGDSKRLGCGLQGYWLDIILRGCDILVLFMVGVFVCKEELYRGKDKGSSFV